MQVKAVNAICGGSRRPNCHGVDGKCAREAYESELLSDHNSTRGPSLPQLRDHRCSQRS